MWSMLRPGVVIEPRSGARRVACAALALLATACTAPSPDAPTSDTPVVARPDANVLLVTIDTLRADRVGVYGGPTGATPVIDGVAARGVTFTSAYSPVPLTLPAHTSLMTGTYPMFHGVRDNVAHHVPDEVETLAEALAARGYRTGAFVSSFVLDSSWGLDQGFETYVDDFDTGGATRFAVGGGQEGLERVAEETVDRSRDWLAEDTARPFFLWVHLFDPHAPYTPPEPYLSRHAGAPYVGEIAYTDAQVGRLLDRLDELGLRDDTVIVIAGDHGESLGEHGEVQHGLFIYEETIRVPLVVAVPGATGGVVRDDPVSLVDVAPTVLEIVGAPPLGTTQGVGLLTSPGPDAAPAERTVRAESLYGRLHYGWSELEGLVGDRYKLIESSDPELYDLDDDPDEARNRVGELNSVYLRLHDELAELEARWAGAGHAAGTGAVDAETRAKLEALGYVGSVRAVEEDPDAPLPSPRSRIDLYNRTLNARSALNAGYLDEAEALLVGVVEEDPGILEARRLLGDVLTRQGRPADAAEVYRDAVPLNPGDPESHLLLADALIAAGDLPAAERALEGALGLVESSPDIWLTLGSTRAQQGDLPGAAAAFEESLRLEPDSEHAHSGLAQVVLGMGDAERARTHARAALAADPGMPRAHFVLAEIARREGAPEEAVREYEAELANQPGNLLARFNLAMVYRELGRPARELATLEEVVQDAPDFPPGRLMLARARLEQGVRLEEAARLVESTLEAPIGDRERLLGYGLMVDLSARLGDAEAAARWQRLRDDLQQRLRG